MRLTTVILIASFLQVSAASFAQRITINQKNVPLKSVLKEIRKQTGFDFFYDGKMVTDDQKIDINIQGVTIDEALIKALTGLDYIYEIQGKKIAIKRKISPSIIDKIKLYFAEITVSGFVIDENGIPLDGALVKVKDSKVFTRTNKNGSFKLADVDDKAILVISYIGYAEKEVKAAPSMGIIRLKLSENPLDQVQVIGYGTQSKRFSLGSVATISGETIRNQPVMNPLLALQGQVPGLNINTQNGAPGARVFVQLRGQNSFANTSPGISPKPYDQPLFIIDGIPFARQNNNINQYANLASSSTIGGGLDQAGGLSPFNNINPNDIESISILKDADATSIYGSEGSNGVIIITTRKGTAGKTQFNTTINTQFNSVAKPVELMNTEQYLQFRKDAFAADGLTPTLSSAPDLLVWDQSKYTNWQDVVFAKGTNNTDVNSSLSGGTGNNTFLISTGFARSNVSFAGGFSTQRFSVNSAFHNTSNDKRLDIDLRTSYGYLTNDAPGAINPQNTLLAPNYPDLINPDGTFNFVYKGQTLNNFYAFLEQSARIQNHNFQSALNLSYKVWKGLTVKTIIGYNRNNSIENSVIPYSSKNPATATATQTAFGNSVAQTINIEPQLTYTAIIGRGVLSALLGGTYKKNAGNSTNITGQGYNNDNLTGSINGAVTRTVGDSYSIRRYAAVFGRINYNYAGKYIAQFTGRRDGSSNFGPGRQFGNFVSVSGGWIFSEENIVKKLVPFLSYGKLSTSYGTTGSDGVGQYLFQTYWGGGLLVVAPVQGVVPSFPQNHYNPDYSWATKRSLNMAADIGFFKDRILLNVTYYRDRTSNQLANSPVPNQTGFTSVVENVDANVQNKGWEFGLNTRNIQSKSFTWESSFNLSFNRNKLLSFPNLASSVSYRSSYVVGQPISMVPNLFKYAGINSANGLPQFYDRNGEITQTPVAGYPLGGGDYTTSINRDVAFGGGLGNALSYKRFRLNFNLQFSSQIAPNFLSVLYRQSRGGIAQQNLPSIVSGNYWMKPGDESKFFKLTSQNGVTQQAFGNYLSSDATYEKVRYVRLKTISLSYNLPESLIKKLHLKSAMLNLNAQNLLTFSNVEVGDPESVGNYGNIPLQRIIALGANFNF